jgi:hypothetical protein
LEAERWFAASDYLAGDGKDGRPLGKLRQWNPKTTQIHGGMKIGDRDTPGTRIYAEREFRDDAQILVATEAAGEGINLQFCWFMVNYDIPWNPVRLEQRMGRIHRYGQEHDRLIFNFVAANTGEGRVLAKLLERLLEIRSELGTDQVFDVVGDPRTCWISTQEIVLPFCPAIRPGPRDSILQARSGPRFKSTFGPINLEITSRPTCPVPRKDLAPFVR